MTPALPEGLPDWHRLNADHIVQLELATYAGEVILIESSSPFDRDKGRFHFNAQEYFSAEELLAMPEYPAVRASDVAPNPNAARSSLVEAEAGADDPLKRYHCQNGHKDLCLSARRDGIVCPADSCDIDDGIVPATPPAPDAGPARQGIITVDRETGKLTRVEPAREGPTPSQSIHEAITRLATMLGESLETGWHIDDPRVSEIIDRATEQVPLKHSALQRAEAAEREVKRLLDGIAVIRSATHTSDGVRIMNVSGMFIQNLCDQILP